MTPSTPLTAEYLLALIGGEPRAHANRRTTRPPMTLSALDQRIAFLQAHAIERSTRKHDCAGVRDYLSFCAAHGLPPDPTPLTLSRYVAYTSLRTASAPKYLSSACYFLRDLYPAFDSTRRHPLVRATIRGSEKVRADPARRKSPLGLSHLSTFATIASQSSDYDDLLFVTILSCAFFACHRIGELVAPNDRSLWDWRKLIKRASLSFSDQHHVAYFLPYHKGDPLYRGTTISFSRSCTIPVIEPTTLLRQYVTRRDRKHGVRTALFLREDGERPTRDWFDKRLFSLLPREVYGRHSARAGGTTYYARLGLSENTIQTLGRWSSTTWKDYARDHPDVRVELQLASLQRSSFLPRSASS